MNLAEQLKAELTQRAKESESCKKYLLDWVMNEFRNGENPVRIYCKDAVDSSNPEWISKAGYKNVKSGWIHFKYENGKHYASTIFEKTWNEITDTVMAQLYAVDGRDESDKTLFLRSEGFRVVKTWIRGMGNVLEITY